MEITTFSNSTEMWVAKHCFNNCEFNVILRLTRWRMLPLKIQRFLPDQQEPTTSPPCQFYLSFRPSRHLFSMDMYFRNY